MKVMPPLVGKLTGVLSLCIGLLVLCREFKIWSGADSIMFIPLMLLIFMLSFYVSPGRKIYLLVAVILTTFNLIWNEQAGQVLTSGFSTGSFIATFFVALTTLKYAAATSPSIQLCGRFLSQQPPGRRYAALTVGGQLFGLLLNYGSISLLGSMTMVNASKEKNEEIRNHRVRRMLLAIQRGFVSTLSWSPLSFAMVIPTSLIPGTSWALCFLPGLVNGVILAGVGWLLDTLFKPKLSTAVVAKRQVEGSWFAILPLIILLLVLISLLAVAYWFTGVRVLALVMVIVPLLSMAWVAVQARGNRPLQQVAKRSSEYLMVQLVDFRGELVLLVMAGYIGTVASPLLGSLMITLNIDLTVVPAWIVLVLMVWLIPLAGQLGMNPILAVTLIAPVLPDAVQLGVSPVAVVISVTAGWLLSGVSSPFTATTMIIGNFAGVSSTHVGQRWNGAYTLICGAILSVWVVVYSGLMG